MATDAANSSQVTAGLYLHVPFCLSRCIYCDFYSTTAGVGEQQAYADAVAHELDIRLGDGPPPTISTLYIGGGTPSILQPEVRRRLFRAVKSRVRLSPKAEITIEANPDDVTPEFCTELVGLGVNRVSLGVQTFDDSSLRLLRRRHTAAEAKRAVCRLAQHGIENISIDLIFGLPGQTLEQWRDNVSTALGLPIKHLSAYALMYEEGTPLTRLRDTGRLTETDEQTSLDMFEVLLDLTAGRMEHYEISNYAYPGFRSRHNSAYWRSVPYIGIGPGAHSFDGKATRRANAAELKAYIAAATAGTDVPHADEHLTVSEQLDECIFTALRTSEGLDVSAVGQRFGRQWAKQLLDAARPHLKAGRLCFDRSMHLCLTRSGLYVSDSVMADLMCCED